MRRARAISRFIYRRLGIRCLWRGHKPWRTRLGFACVCGLQGDDYADFNHIGGHVPPLRTTFSRRHGGSIERSVGHEEPTQGQGWRNW